MKAEETFNMFFVSARGDQILIMNPANVLTKPQALNLAAWLVAMADQTMDHEDFLKVLNAIEST